jgi:isoamylase
VTEQRLALIIGTTNYSDAGLQQLRSPGTDAQALADVLADIKIGEFKTTLLLDQTADTLRRAIEQFYQAVGKEDLAVTHIASHGVKDDDGNLYFAASDTQLNLLESTGIAASFVNRQMARSRCLRKLLLLDCCFSGAFSPGLMARGGAGVDIKERFAGRGQIVLTASSSIEYAFEGELPKGQGVGSVFTSALIGGLRDGSADRDGDGWISIDELYDHIADVVAETTPNQTPRKWNFDVQGSIRVARSPLGPRPQRVPRGTRQLASFVATDPLQLGATWDGSGTNFAVASSVADAMTLCLFDEAGKETRIPLVDYDAGVWHGFVPGVGPGQAYGYRAAGPYDPARGLRCNPAKLLLDPYARAISGEVTFGPQVLGYAVGETDAPSALDSARYVPRSVVIDDTFEWSDGTKPMHPYRDTVIYEVHVKGFTMCHPQVPPELRGTYAGLAHKAAINHLVDLGVTAVELLPVHENVSWASSLQRGLTNYWGYNTISYFAPHQGYSAEVRAGRPGGQVAEFKSMVDALHAAGIEVILDVVYNHTAEGNHLGPTLSHRGLDNPSYYRLNTTDPSFYLDTTGTGNSLNVGNPKALQMIMDSLRYWLTSMGVDGFRFDLAPTLARQDYAFDQMSSFLTLVSQDPIISRAKLIAEPWDLGHDGYALGRFPPLWCEWNGKYSATMRDFWRSHNIGLAEFATRLCGSLDLFERRGPTASVNFVTCHDGFTLRDLVSYHSKHNKANGENNRDGTNDNRSWNCGAEGPTTDPAILALRQRQSRAILTTLLLSFGVPMLLGGDEMGRTQQGNNNGYCQDNELTWVDWSSTDDELLAFTRRLIALRKEHPVFRRRFFPEAETSELGWFAPAGTSMTEADWADDSALSLTLYLNGSSHPDWAAVGQDDDFLVLFNAWWEPLEFVIPATRDGQAWRIEINSYDLSAAANAFEGRAGDWLSVGPRSVTVLRGLRPRSR